MKAAEYPVAIPYLFILLLLLAAGCTSRKQDKPASPEKNNTDTIAGLFQKKKEHIHTAGILLYDGYTTLDAMGPYQVLSELMGVKVFFVGRKKGLIKNMNGVSLQVDTSITDVKNLDILVIPGGFKETYLATKDTILLNWIKEIDQSSVYTTSVCTGAWILGAAGLLKNKEATTHWYGKKILSEQFGAIVRDKRYIKSGKYWTSAGVTAGMDMSLALVNEIMGEQYVKMVMLDLEYDPMPPYDAGSEQKTEKEIVEKLRSMYDGGMKAVLHPGAFFSAMDYENRIDPVCGMPVETGVSDTAVFQGKTIGFCSEACKNTFKNNKTKNTPK